MTKPAAADSLHVVDDPEHCDFFYPASCGERSADCDLHVRVSPAFARRLRQKLEAQFGEEYGVARSSCAPQRRSAAQCDDPAERRRIWKNWR